VETPGLRLLGRLESHTNTVCALRFSKDGEILATGSLDSTIKLWKLGGGLQKNPLHSTLTAHADAVTSLDFNGASFNGVSSRLISGSWDGTVRLWMVDVERPRLKATVKGHGAYAEVMCVRMNVVGNVAASAAESEIKLWNVDRILGIKDWGENLQHRLRGHTDTVWCMEFNASGEWLCSGSTDKTVRIWDTTTGEQLGCIYGHADAVRSVIFVHEHVIASASDDHTVRLWDGKTCKALPGSVVIAAHHEPVRSLALSDDGMRLLSMSAQQLFISQISGLWSSLRLEAAICVHKPIQAIHDPLGGLSVCATSATCLVVATEWRVLVLHCSLLSHTCPETPSYEVTPPETPATERTTPMATPTPPPPATPQRASYGSGDEASV